MSAFSSCNLPASIALSRYCGNCSATATSLMLSLRQPRTCSHRVRTAVQRTTSSTRRPAPAADFPAIGPTKRRILPDSATTSASLRMADASRAGCDAGAVIPVLPIRRSTSAVHLRPQGSSSAAVKCNGWLDVIRVGCVRLFMPRTQGGVRTRPPGTNVILCSRRRLEHFKEQTAGSPLHGSTARSAFPLENSQLSMLGTHACAPWCDEIV